MSSTIVTWIRHDPIPTWSRGRATGCKCSPVLASPLLPLHRARHRRDTCIKVQTASRWPGATCFSSLLLASPSQ
jgi:hypothetical protein